MNQVTRRSLLRETIVWIASLPPLPHRARGAILRVAGIDIARTANVRAGVRVAGSGRVLVEDGAFINEGVYLDATAPITILACAQIGDHVRLITATHEIDPQGARVAGELRAARIEVGAGAWIGSGATVLPGVSVGHHAILGAGAVALSDLEPYGVYVGVPARLLRSLKPGSSP